MARATTPSPGPQDLATPSTPGATTTTNTSNTTNMPVARNTPLPSTPGHRCIASTPRTPDTSPLTCSSSPNAFTFVRVHTAKCSECDLRNKDTMLRCPRCTFQVCKPCQERREKAGRSLAHGNMVSPGMGNGTPGTGGGVVRRRPVGVTPVKSVEKEKEKDTGERGGREGERVEEEGKDNKHMLKGALKPKAKPKPRVRDVTPSDNSSEDDFAPDPASPTSNKRRRTGLSRSNSGASRSQDAAVSILGDSLSTGRPLSDMTTDEILALYDVNTPTNPYRAHFLGRQEPVVSDPVIQIPVVVKRGFKPRPTAEEIQKNIQDKVRQKMGLPTSDGGTHGDE